jgi:hypothetical protein
MARRFASVLLVALAAALTVFAFWLEVRHVVFPLAAPDLILRLGRMMAFLAYFVLVLQYA